MDLRRQVTPTAELLLEGEELITTEGMWGAQASMHVFGGLWSGDTQVLLNPLEGGTAAVVLSAPEAGTYRLFASFTRGPDFGIHRFSVGAAPGPSFDAYAPRVYNTGVVDLGAFELRAGANQLDVLTEGKSPQSVGWLLGIDYLLLRREGE